LDVIVSMKSWMGSGPDRLLFLFLPLKNSRHRRLPWDFGEGKNPCCWNGIWKCGLPAFWREDPAGGDSNWEEIVVDFMEKW